MTTTATELTETIDPIAPCEGNVGSARQFDHCEVRAFRARLLSNGFWVIFGRSVGFVGVLVASAVLARCLSKAEFADFSVVVSLVAFTSGLAAFGLDTIILQRVSGRLAVHDKAEAAHQMTCVLRVARTTSFLAAVGVGLFLYAFGHAVFGLHDLSLLAPVLALTVMFVSYQQVSAEGMRCLGKVSLANFLTGGRPGGPAGNMIFLVLIIVAFCMAATNFRTVILLNLGAALAATTIAAIALLSARRKIFADAGPVPNGGIDLGVLFRASVPLMALRCVVFFTVQADLWIAASSFHSRDDVALYSAAQRLLTLINLPLEMSMFLVLTTIVELNRRGKRKELQQIVRAVATLAAVPALAGVAVLLLFGRPLFGLYYGPEYRSAASIFAVLALGQFAVIFTGNAGYVLMLTGRQNLLLMANLGGAAILFGFGYIAASRYGATGLATVSAVAVTFQCLSQWILARWACGVWTHLGAVKWNHVEPSPALARTAVYDTV